MNQPPNKPDIEPQRHPAIAAMARHLSLYARAYLVLIASLALVAAAAYYQTRAAAAHRQAAFAQVALQAQAKAVNTLETYVNVLHGIRGLYGASVSVERDEFHAYVDATGILKRLPALEAIGYVEIVDAARIAGRLAQIAADKSIDPLGYPRVTMVPPGARPQYAIVAYMEPSPASAHAPLGFDIAASAEYRHALRCVGMVRSTCATQPLHTGADSHEDDSRFALLMPVYRNDAADAHLQGYVLALMSLTQLTREIVGNNNAVAIEISNSAQLGAHPWKIQAGANNRGLVATATFDLVGRAWGIRVGALPAFLARDNNDAVDMTLIGGGALALLVFLALVMRTHSIAQRSAQSAALMRQAKQDTLTGLPNRYLLYEELQQRLARGANQPLALLLIDLNGFKEINDTLGHNSGDAVLREMSRRLREALRADDMVARLGGDEFAVLIRATNEAQIDVAVERLLRTIGRPFALAGLVLRIDASVGIAVFPQDGKDVSTLLRCADVAMYAAKTTSAAFARYNANHDMHTPKRLALISELGEAIARDQLVLHYQPIIDVAQGKVVSLEALVRWQHPQYGLIPPDQFIPAAEKSEVIRPLTLWVLKESLRQIHRWREAGFELGVAVNISARNLLDTELEPQISALLIDHRVDASRLTLEITETAMMNDADRSLATLTRLHESGIGIGIDDFGTGYSSLAYLKKLPAQVLKIDRSFIKDLADTGNDVAIVRHTIDLARSLGMDVVAEGVETAEAMTILLRLGCSHAQGYYIARPLPAVQLTDWLQSRVSAFNTVALAQTRP